MDDLLTDAVQDLLAGSGQPGLAELRGLLQKLLAERDGPRLLEQQALAEPRQVGIPPPIRCQRRGALSRGEFGSAKRSCMKFQNAWVSDRTLCYLASGKPAVVQDTGSYLPSGEGLFSVLDTRRCRRRADLRKRGLRAPQPRGPRAGRDVFDAREILSGLLERAL